MALIGFKSLNYKPINIWVNVEQVFLLYSIQQNCLALNPRVSRLNLIPCLINHR